MLANICDGVAYQLATTSTGLVIIIATSTLRFYLPFCQLLLANKPMGKLAIGRQVMHIYQLFKLASSIKAKVNVQAVS